MVRGALAPALRRNRYVFSYVFIGWEIFAFKTPDEITRYVSLMGNSAVPYPYAVGARNTYLFLERTYLTNEHLAFLREQLRQEVVIKVKKVKGFRTQRDVDDADPYTLYYTRDLETGSSADMPRRHKLHAQHKAAHKLSGFKVLHERIG